MKNFQNLSVPQTVVRSIQDNCKGNNSLSVGGVRSLVDRHSPREGKFKLRGQFGHLTPRETTVLQLIAEGKANKEAASELCLSIKTIGKYRESIMLKLGIRGTALLTHFAIATGIVQVNPCLGVDGARNQGFHQALR